MDDGVCENHKNIRVDVDLEFQLFSRLYVVRCRYSLRIFKGKTFINKRDLKHLIYPVFLEVGLGLAKG